MSSAIANLTPPGLPGLSDRDRATIQKLLGYPIDFPQAFKSWLISYLEANPPRFGITGMDGYEALASSVTTAGTSLITPVVLQSSDVAVTHTTEAAADQIVASGAFNLTAAGTVWVEFNVPAWFNNNTARVITLIVAFSTDGGATWTPNGQVWRDTRAAATTDLGGFSMGFPFAGASTSIQLSIRAYASSSTNVTVRAGNYGSAGYVPASIRITKAT